MPPNNANKGAIIIRVDSPGGDMDRRYCLDRFFHEAPSMPNHPPGFKAGQKVREHKRSFGAWQDEPTLTIKERRGTYNGWRYSFEEVEYWLDELNISIVP